MEIDIAVRALLGAQAAADTPVLDYYFQRIAPANRSHRAADHAQRIQALAAGGRHQVMVEAQPLADQPGDAVVRISAGPHACIATGAAVQVQQQQTLRFHQTLREKAVERNALGYRQALAIHLHAVLFHGLKLPPHGGKLAHHAIEVFGTDANQFHMIERRARRRADVAGKQSGFAKIIAARKIGEHHISARMRLRHLHETYADKIETVGGVALPANHLARRATHKFHALAQAADELACQLREDWNGPEVAVKSTPAVGFVQLGAESL